MHSTMQITFSFVPILPLHSCKYERNSRPCRDANNVISLSRLRNEAETSLPCDTKPATVGGNTTCVEEAHLPGLLHAFHLKELQPVSCHTNGI